MICYVRTQSTLRGTQAVDCLLSLPGGRAHCRWCADCRYRATDKEIRWFWEIVEEMDDFHRTQLVRFTWGRSRVPTTRVWQTKFKIVKRDQPLPTAHTCFFKLDLPGATSKKQMKKGLMTALNFGVGGIING